ncbi:MAG: GNAT family protein [Paracoccus sp. (in: a-proteobacteria)]
MTERFLLRPLRPSDAELIAHYTADRRVAGDPLDSASPAARRRRAYVRRALSTDRDEDVWAIDGSANRLAELLGVVSLTRMEADQSELGFWVGAGFWNTGFRHRGGRRAGRGQSPQVAHPVCRGVSG